MKFDKCHGLGNDYVYVDGKELSLADAQLLAPQLCRRGPGVGADGIIIMGQMPESNMISMRMVNADGSEGLICGNGLRCVAHLARKWQWVSDDEMIIDTAVGPRRAVIEKYTPQESNVTVEMGFPNFDKVGFECEGPQGKWNWHGVSMGNPHAVTLMPEGSEVDGLDFNKWGPFISNHPHYSGGVNVNFLFKVAEDQLISRIWERGSGPTFACGSGACAGFAVARREGWVGDKAEVALELGSLTMSWAESKGILMTGPATWSYTAQCELQLMDEL